MTIQHVATFSSGGPTSDGRSKPDLVAPGTSILTASNTWQSGSLLKSWSGTSFAAPQAAGLAAQMIDYGRAHALSTDPRVLEGGDDELREQDVELLWRRLVTFCALSTRPAAREPGALNAPAAALAYIAGDFNPGARGGTKAGRCIRSPGLTRPPRRWTVTIFLLSPTVGSYIDATLVWNQHVTYHDSGTLGVLDPGGFLHRESS